MSGLVNLEISVLFHSEILVVHYLKRLLQVQIHKPDFVKGQSKLTNVGLQIDGSNS